MTMAQWWIWSPKVDVTNSKHNGYHWVYTDYSLQFASLNLTVCIFGKCNYLGQWLKYFLHGLFCLQKSTYFFIHLLWWFHSNTSCSLCWRYWMMTGVEKLQWLVTAASNEGSASYDTEGCQRSSDMSQAAASRLVSTPCEAARPLGLLAKQHWTAICWRPNNISTINPSMPTVVIWAQL